MGRPVRVTVSSAASSAVIPLSLNADPFNVGIGCDVSAGASLTYTVQHTFDDVFSPTFNPSTATWFSNSVIVSQTADRDGNYAYPVTAVRLTVTAWTSGSVTMTVIQAGF
jgi:hypothetical protein